MFNLLILALAAFTASAQPRTQYVSQCDELDIGKDLHVYVPNRRSPTTVTHSYSLRRNSFYEHEVFLNVKFHQPGTPTMDVKTLNSYYKTRAQSCLDKDAEMFADQSGRTLKITIFDQDLHGKKVVTPPLVEISIEPKGHRSNSRAHESNVDCKTLVHEYLHLLGLVDEYEETNKEGLFKRVNAYPSRAISTDHSWMRYHYSVSFLGTGLGKKKKFLYKGQLDAVLFPNCESRNGLYYTCAKNAYNWHLDPNAPAICKTREDWLQGGTL
ncbi:MAG TPA: hypothetical protein VNJ01_16140 [Bacteriovoracaceae bacterium]|nr:hypothetical protein [Bacteriovoracaceae bacterium]